MDKKDLPAVPVYPTSPLGEQVANIPTGRDVEWEPLVDYRRNGVSENTIHGAVSWFSGDKQIHSFGGNVLCYGRSMMKLLYIKVFAEELASATNWKQKAIALASHNGSAEHIEAAQSLLSEPEWGLMLTPLDVPLVQFGRQVRRPGSLHDILYIKGRLPLHLFHIEFRIYILVSLGSRRE